jgi:hypothetical protein
MNSIEYIYNTSVSGRISDGTNIYSVSNDIRNADFIPDVINIDSIKIGTTQSNNGNMYVIMSNLTNGIIGSFIGTNSSQSVQTVIKVFRPITNITLSILQVGTDGSLGPPTLAGGNWYISVSMSMIKYKNKNNFQ